MKHPLKENHDIVKEQLENRISQSVIARKYGVSRQAVNSYAQKHFPDVLESLKPSTCKECGGSLEGKRIGTKHCSATCSWKAWRQEHKREMTCAYCGKTELKTEATTYCSVKCARASTQKIYPEEVIERHAKGGTIQQIADSLESTPGSIYGSLYRHGFRLTGRRE